MTGVVGRHYCCEVRVLMMQAEGEATAYDKAAGGEFVYLVPGCLCEGVAGTGDLVELFIDKRY